MFLRCLGFVLVLSYSGELHAQSSTKDCQAPQLEGGFLLPQRDTYSHGSRLAYACNTGYRPPIEGWWATSVCFNGLWTHTPQCIDENGCLPPNIPNGKCDPSPEGSLYNDGSVVRIKCDEGYEHKLSATATCQKGHWSDLPSCEPSETSCNEPAKIPNAVLLHKYQDIFADKTKVQYECEDGYSVEKANARKLITCDAGVWKGALSCIRSKPAPEEDEDTSDDIAKPADRSRGSGGGVGANTGDATGASTGGDTITESETGSATTSDKPGRSPLVTAVANCGNAPHVPNGDVVQRNPRFIKYACNAFYKRIGPNKVMCYSNGTWSELPTCKEAYCEVDLDVYKSYFIQESGTIFVKEGEAKRVQCMWSEYFSQITCVNRKERVTRCCHYWDIDNQRCS
ncbi:complement factor H-related protein 1-like [Festucalex cinctus]